MKLEFTTTATCRPSIVRKTYTSFTSHLVGIDYKKSTLYLNIDPIPFENDPQLVVKVARKFFGKVVVNIPKEPNFCQAVRWCWCQPQGDQFFHLEDDWVLNGRIHINTLLHEMARNGKRCFGVNLRAYMSIKSRRICLSPCLLKSKIAKEIALDLNPRCNPEKQLRPKTLDNKIGGKAKKYFNVHYPNTRSVIRDIGRIWLEKSRYNRGAGPSFITWTK